MVASDFAIATLPPSPRTAPWGMLASVAFHGALAGALLLLSPLREMALPPTHVVTVDIVPSSQLEQQQPKPAVTSAPTGLLIAPSTDRLTTTEPLVPDVPETQTVTATEFYSANILREPGSQRTRQVLTTFADRERVIQICNIEALEQIHRAAPAYEPDTVVGYAMADLAISGMALTAAGGAFRSRRRWYEVSYHCTAAPGYEGVTAFDFTLGAEIPESQWEAHSLNAADADKDDK